MRVSGVSVPASRELLRAWQTVLGKLQLELNSQVFATWLEQSRPATIQQGRLFIETGAGLVLPWVNDHLAHIVRRHVCEVMEQDLAVEFVPRGYQPPSLAGETPTAGLEDVRVTAPPISTPMPAGIVGRVNSRYSLDHYLPARGNRYALDSCVAILTEDEAAPPAIAIWGAPGLGKTHLLHGVAQRAQAAGWPTACLSAEEFTSRYQDALRLGDVSALKNCLRNVRLFILDDLQYLVGKTATQGELVNTIDAVSDAGGHIVVAGELHPRELNLPERLNTRLSEGVVAHIEPFDTDERRTFVECVARRMRASLPGWAIERIAAIGPVPARLVQGAVNAAIGLQRSDMLSAAALDLEISRLAIHSYSSANATPEDIIETIACHYGTTPGEICGRSRKPAIASARAAAAATLTHQGKSLADLAVIFGRHRSTLGPVVERGRKLLAADSTLRARLAC